jgi:RNA polymerase sigma-70 factor (ECF subfamily)
MTIDTEADEKRWSAFMAAAHRGDARLYETLLTELGDVIERYVRRRIGHLGFTEDCVQECLLAIHTGRHTYDPRKPFRPWFFAIVRNKTIDLLRRSYSVARLVRDETTRSISRGYEPDPADELVASELLACLEPHYRAAIELTKLRGYSTAEAAARAGVSETAMRTRVSRALRAAVLLIEKEQNE